MCTAITLKNLNGDNFFGRTMDFSYPIDPGFYVIPKNYEWNSVLTSNKYKDKYSFICIGQEIGDLFGIFDGVNEKGFAAASLYFKGYAYYDLPVDGKNVVSSLDFIHYLLGNCSSLEDLKFLLKNISIVGQEDPVTKTAAPLHWIATDRSGRSVVIEQVKSGLKIMNNPIGVMANSPNFSWQMTNLRNYMNVSVEQQEKVYWGDVALTPFGQGAGTGYLPGGFTSPERFVRAAFLKTHVQKPKTRLETVGICFHIMNSVFIPKGIVKTEKETDDYTKYVAFINTNTCEYYFKTYDNNQVMVVRLKDHFNTAKKLIFLGSIKKHPITLEYF